MLAVNVSEDIGFAVFKITDTTEPKSLSAVNTAQHHCIDIC